MKTPDFLKFNWQQVPTKREKIIFFVTLFVLAAMLTKSCALESSKILSDASAQLNNLEIELKNLSNFQPIETNVIKAPSKKWVGTKANLENLITQITQPIYLNNIVILESKISPGTNQLGLISTKITLNFIGNLEATLDYLNYLQKMPTPLVILNITMTNNAENSDQIRTDLIGEAYAYPN